MSTIPAVDANAEEAIGTDRCYMMLEQKSVCELLHNAIEKVGTSGPADELYGRLADYFGDAVIYEPLGFRTARNAAQAYRHEARERFGDSPGSSLMVAVATKMWKPKDVSSKVHHNVSIA